MILVQECQNHGKKLFWTKLIFKLLYHLTIIQKQKYYHLSVTLYLVLILYVAHNKTNNKNCFSF